MRRSAKNEALWPLTPALSPEHVFLKIDAIRGGEGDFVWLVM
jgi:hypothetical protein